jgi:hypothetical protein
LKKEYVRRLRLILNTELSARNKMQATGSLALLTDIKKKYRNWIEEQEKC